MSAMFVYRRVVFVFLWLFIPLKDWPVCLIHTFAFDAVFAAALVMLPMLLIQRSPLTKVRKKNTQLSSVQNPVIIFLWLVNVDSHNE